MAPKIDPPRRATIPRATAFSSATLISLAGCSSFTDLSRLTPAEAQRPGLVIDWAPDTVWAARVTIACAITSTGRTAGCRLDRLVGNPTFGPSALAFARSLIFVTGFASGHGKARASYRFHIGFQPAGRFAPPGADAALAYAPTPPYIGPPGLARAATVTLSCTITAEGDPTGCAIIANDGPPALAPFALAIVARAHYVPAWRQGLPVAASHHRITLHLLPPDPYPGLPDPAANPGHGPGERLQDLTPVYASQGPVYPTESAYAHHEGSALIGCVIPLSGPLRACRVLAVHGDRAFGSAARYDLSHRILRLTRNGHPASAPFVQIVRFSLAQNHW